MPSARARIALLSILVAAAPLVCLEFPGFALTKVTPDLFDHRQQVRGVARIVRPLAASP